MILSLLIIPLLGCLAILPIKEKTAANSLSTTTLTRGVKKVKGNGLKLIKQIALGFSILNLFLSIYIWSLLDSSTTQYQFVSELFPLLSNSQESISLVQSASQWINFSNATVGLDTTSIYFVLLTTFITPVCILSNWNNIQEKMKFYLILFLILETLQIAVFVVLDLLLFYIFFEAVLIPLFFIVGVYGAGLPRLKAAFMLFIYTLFGSLWMLLSIMVIYYNYGSTDFEFINYSASLGTSSISLDHQKLLWIGFFISFAFKTPLFPFHLWLGFAHSVSPLGGSIILASVILKLATYGFLRILIPILPDATYLYSPIVQLLAVITLVYASLLTLIQEDSKRLIAYSSIAHCSVIVIGLFSNTIQGIEGAILLALSHGFISPALFTLLGGHIYDRFHTRNIALLRGLSLTMPIFSILFFISTLANMSVPLSLNFAGEFLSLYGAFEQNPIVGVIMSTGIFFSACYSIWLFTRITFGQPIVGMNYPTLDVLRIEFFLVFTLIFITFLLGIYPTVILSSLDMCVANLIYTVA